MNLEELKATPIQNRQNLSKMWQRTICKTEKNITFIPNEPL